MKNLPIYLLALMVFIGCAKEPTANFTFTDNQKSDTPVIFTNTSENANSYEWDFGDGVTSSLASPIHTYDRAGLYAVNLIASGKKSDDVITKHITITGPLASFTFTDNMPVGSEVEFTNTSTGADTYFWVFGDGDISTEESPKHSFVKAGDHTVILNANAGISSDEASEIVKITGKTFSVKNVTSTDITDVETFFMDDSDIYEVIQHGNLRQNQETDPESTNYLQRTLFFTFYDIACITYFPYSIVEDKHNLMIMADTTSVYCITMEKSAAWKLADDKANLGGETPPVKFGDISKRNW